jgi:hypothetical protein
MNGDLQFSSPLPENKVAVCAIRERRYLELGNGFLELGEVFPSVAVS